MSPKEARMEVIELIDNHCRQCDNKCSRDFVYCWMKCEIGKKLNEIGVVLGGKVFVETSIQRTKEEWDKICEETIKLKENGMKYVEIANKFHVSYGQLRKQLNRHNMKK
ncbi:zinc-finger domain-containing protein [Bacillus sp. FDAARGOS_235]|uniref:zinc-finger domain-containing protein n=1 Tax=Bacillus sp. FDAARGOS_235 TaxID=1839798 RepID=UPI00119D37CB|nr:zinc-finger domain-containing protein [Bacillus sp. FDAARGOS_235]